MVLNICPGKLSMREPVATIQGSIQNAAASALMVLEDLFSKTHCPLTLLSTPGSMHLQIFGLLLNDVAARISESIFTRSIFSTPSRWSTSELSRSEVAMSGSESRDFSNNCFLSLD